ncbi:helix-turn-helix transcriptional regulator [Candidatus Symbiopectobacterium sp. NZEC151]|uniref:helix-turn-helix transcriptional regulator n=1 Tax=Candidatus Symbiopectobacterium sp. NZEC151 TaxID=2820470 RepID=UPI0022265659|nr:helix-turn-helix transcriptional regulator [Candidatus Symbiopectobacterium sp. NZEC151]
MNHTGQALTLPVFQGEGRERWRLPSSSPVVRHGLCALAQPCLRQPQQTARFQFHEATVLLVVSGQMRLAFEGHQVLVDATRPALVLVEAGSCVDVVKTPGGVEHCFRSVFMTIANALLENYSAASSAVAGGDSTAAAPFQGMPLDDDVASTLWHLIESVAIRPVSDERLTYRLLELLSALAERGHLFRLPRHNDTVARLQALMGGAPHRHWTAREAGRELAMSEATLRRRLAAEQQRFETILSDIRMHHGMMLLQTTAWSIPRIAEACGYQSRARFSERFRTRFGCLPSAIR